MIRAVDFQKLDMTDEEYAYYKNLVAKFENGVEYFRGLFVSDENGIITIITPTKPIPWDVMFFIQNLMINQHIHDFDNRIKKLEEAKTT